MNAMKEETANISAVTLGRQPGRTRTELGLLASAIHQATDDDVVLTASLDSGATIEGESAILARKSGEPICSVSLARRDGLMPDANPEALDAIAKADAIVIGPGDLFASIVPSLLVPDIADAIRRSEARKIFVCNIMTQAGRTTAFSVGDHVRAVQSAGGVQIDYVLVNNRQPGEKLSRAYHEALQSQVVFAPEAADRLSEVTFANSSEKFVLVEGAFLVEADLLTENREELYADDPSGKKTLTVIRHDPDKLRAALSALIRQESWRLAN